MKTILYIIYIITILVCSTSLMSQDIENKLHQAFSEDKVHAILNNPQTKAYYTTVLTNSFELNTYPAGKLKPNSLPVLSSITITSKDKSQTTLTVNEIITQIENKSFNILLSSIERKFDKRLIYRLGNTNKVLTIHAHKELIK